MRHALAETVMGPRRLPRQAGAHDFHVRHDFLDEAERHHRAVVELRHALRARAAVHARLRKKARKGFHQLRIVFRREFQSRRAEIAEIPFRMLPRRDMEIIGVHRRVRAGNQHGIGLQCRHPAHRLPVRVDGRLYLSFLAAPNLRHDQRRMRHSDGSDNSHDTTSSHQETL